MAACDEVAPRLFVGDRGAPARAHALGVQLVINLAPREVACAPDVDTMCVDAEDSAAYDLLAHVEPVLARAAPVLDAGGAVLLHCYAGASRSVAMAVAVLMARGMPGCARPTALQAFERVRAARGCAQPNPGFVRQLWRLEDQLGRRSERSVALWYRPRRRE